MEHKITIKPLNNTYVDQIIDLILPIQQIEFQVPVTLETQPDLLDIEANYFAGGGHFWGAVNDQNELIGSIALIANGHHAGTIRKMFVKKEFRGKELSLAQQLLDELIRYSRANQITDLYLGTADILKAAQRFYERNGFIKIKMEDLPEYFPRMLVDNLFYHLYLGSHK